MKNAKRIATGLAFTAAFALSLLASGGDADAKTKTGGRAHLTNGADITAPAAPANFDALGVTWE
ncbi:MAG: hypothetical protein Q7S41_02380 [Candidatus Limnocylindria bacterium]|nr:hypothetical protein [Candidatus Limnocylindria bacterium]